MTMQGNSYRPPDHWRGEVRGTARLALPLALSHLAAIAITTTDVVMTGWLGPTQLAAQALAVNFVLPMEFFGLGLAVAVSPMIAHDRAGGEVAGVRRTLRQGLWVVALFSLPLMLGLYHSASLLRAFGQNPDLSLLAQGYLHAVMWGVAPHFFFNIFRNFLAAHERPRAAVVIILIAIMLNAAGNYVLMFGKFGLPRLELVGLGIATTGTHIFKAVALAVFIAVDKEFRRYRAFVRFFKPDWPRFWEIVRLGAPIGGGLLAETAMIAAMALMVGLIGATPLAAHAIAWQCVAVAYMIPLGVSQAVTVRVGLASGAGDRPAARRAGGIGFAMGLAAALPPSVAFLLWPGALAALFLDFATPGHQAALGLAVLYLTVAAFFQVGDAAQALALGALRGLKDTRAPMLIAIVGYWAIGVPAGVILAFPLGLGGVGVWGGMAAGLTSVGLALAWRFYRLSR